MLARHDPDQAQASFARLRLVSQYTYIGALTPAAVIAVAAGTALIFLRHVFEPWMFAKLAAVGLLVCLHGWLGHVLVRIGETAGERQPPNAAVMITLAIVIIAAVLLLVLGKPSLSPEVVPGWLSAPLGRSLPLSETPTW
jgi:uncharacterized membrane protein